MTMNLDPTISGDPRNAHVLAAACELAYLDEAQGTAGFREKLGLEAKFISVDNTQVYVGQNENSVVIAFRGSEAPTTLDGLKDWLLTNANNYLILPEGRSGTDFVAAGVGARFHRGFLDALENLWNPFFTSVDAAIKTQPEERPVWVTGHSLGGAIALLAAWRLQRQFVAIHEIVTFGAPMIGNDVAAKAFEQEFEGKLFRYVDLEDPVPLLPSVSLVANTYAHSQAEVALAATKVASVLETLQKGTGAAVQGLLDATLIDELWGMVQNRIGSHFISNYQSKVERKLKDRV